MDDFFTSPQQPNSDQRQHQPKYAAEEIIKPPPIIIYQVRNYDIVYNYLNTKFEQCYKIALLNRGDLKLNVETEDHYRTASKMLNEAKYTWSSYENK